MTENEIDFDDEITEFIDGLKQKFEQKFTELLIKHCITERPELYNYYLRMLSDEIE